MSAKAGIQSLQSGSDGKAWIPAFAGMTVNSSYRFISLQMIAPTVQRWTFSTSQAGDKPARARYGAGDASREGGGNGPGGSTAGEQKTRRTKRLT